MNKLLAIDVDGVLNSHRFNHISQAYGLEKSCVDCFNKIIHIINPRFVFLVSAWRYMILNGAMTIEGFSYLLRTHGVTEKLNLVGCCGPDIEGNLSARGLVIDNWLKSNGTVGKLPFLILDDCPPGMNFSPHQDKLYQTDGKTGLVESDVEKIIKKFKEMR